MRRPTRFIARAAAVAALAACASAGAFDDVGEQGNRVLDTAPTGEQMTLDLIVVRPLSLVGTVLGTAVFVVALPINALTLNFKDPARRLILEPAAYTFVRPLGDLD
ncbi:MAG: hypothetical protein ACT4PK_01760 [Gammaproteobacteria bacterium]